MFGFGKKAPKTYTVTASQTGRAVPLTEVPDEVFSQKMLGDGLAVLPENELVLAPVAGELIEVPDSRHAYCIHTPDGLDVLLHIGINTVELKGEGFTCLVKAGDTVKAGQKLAKVDLELLKQHGYPLYTPIIITNMDAVKTLETHPGETKAGETVIMEYTIS